MNPTPMQEEAVDRPVFDKLLIANRGEIAVRIMRTCNEMGIDTVAIHSAADAGALHVRTADEAVDLGDGPASENYLNVDAIVAAAVKTGAQAVHPGYGFLAENATFAQAVVDAGLVFIGPPPSAITAMGEKVAARSLAIQAGVPLAPGSEGVVESADEVAAFGAEHGYPLLVKASAGGGGRGMRRINAPGEVAAAFDSASREAVKAFGNGDLYVERYVVDARHVEVQVFADAHGNSVWVGDRDCSVQRRHQKVIEEAPAPGLSDEVRRSMGEASARLASEVGYRGAGTVEFLVDGDKFYFLEMNTRIQVEHPVTELVQGVDLVAEQIRVAAGHPLTLISGATPNGVAIEARINAESVADGAFLPNPGPITALDAPTGEGLRWDAGYEAGDTVQPFYDNLMGKLIAWAPTRDEAIERLDKALGEVVVGGVETAIPAVRAVLRHADFRGVTHHTGWLESGAIDFASLGAEPVSRQEVVVGGRYYTIPVFTEGVVSVPGPAVPAVSAADSNGFEGNGRPRQARAKRAAAFDGTLKAPMQGTVVRVEVADGQSVNAGDILFVVEAMKMENPVTAPIPGVVNGVSVAVGDTVAAGTALATLAEAA